MSIGLKGNNDGSGAIQVGGSDAISISTGLSVTMNGGVVYPLTSGTAVTASGTSIDFTGIPATAKRVTVMFSGVSTNGTSNLLVQIGSGSVTTTGYVSASSIIEATVVTTAYTTGFGYRSNAAAAINNGAIVITNVSGNIWCAQGVGSITTSTTGTITSGGALTLSGTLDRIRITTVNGTDTFDAGSINILWE